MKALGKELTDVRKPLEVLWKMKMPTPDEASALTAITNRLEEDRTALIEAADELENHQGVYFHAGTLAKKFRISAGVK